MASVYSWVKKYVFYALSKGYTVAEIRMHPKYMQKMIEDAPPGDLLSVNAISGSHGHYTFADVKVVTSPVVEGIELILS